MLILFRGLIQPTVFFLQSASKVLILEVYPIREMDFAIPRLVLVLVFARLSYNHTVGDVTQWGKKSTNLFIFVTYVDPTKLIITRQPVYRFDVVDNVAERCFSYIGSY